MYYFLFSLLLIKNKLHIIFSMCKKNKTHYYIVIFSLIKKKE